jgi:hypothetical protein
MWSIWSLLAVAAVVVIAAEEVARVDYLQDSQV